MLKIFEREMLTWIGNGSLRSELGKWKIRFVLNKGYRKSHIPGTGL